MRLINGMRIRLKNPTIKVSESNTISERTHSLLSGKPGTAIVAYVGPVNSVIETVGSGATQIFPNELLHLFYGPVSSESDG